MYGLLAFAFWLELLQFRPFTAIAVAALGFFVMVLRIRLRVAKAVFRLSINSVMLAGLLLLLVVISLAG